MTNGKKFTVSVKYSCGLPDPQVLPIIVVDRYLDYLSIPGDSGPPFR